MQKIAKREKIKKKLSGKPKTAENEGKLTNLVRY